VGSIGLRVAVHSGKVYLAGLTDLHKGLTNEHTLAAALGANDDEIVTALYPTAQYCQIRLYGGGLEDCAFL
jgi:hypothetical protein